MQLGEYNYILDDDLLLKPTTSSTMSNYGGENSINNINNALNNNDYADISDLEPQYHHHQTSQQLLQQQQQQQQQQHQQQQHQQQQIQQQHNLQQQQWNLSHDIATKSLSASVPTTGVKSQQNRLNLNSSLYHQQQQQQQQQRPQQTSIDSQILSATNESSSLLKNSHRYHNYLNNNPNSLINNINNNSYSNSSNNLNTARNHHYNNNYYHRTNSFEAEDINLLLDHTAASTSKSQYYSTNNSHPSSSSAAGTGTAGATATGHGYSAFRTSGGISGSSLGLGGLASSGSGSGTTGTGGGPSTSGGNRLSSSSFYYSPAAGTSYTIVERERDPYHYRSSSSSGVERLLSDHYQPRSHSSNSYYSKSHLGTSSLATGQVTSSASVGNPISSKMSSGKSSSSRHNNLNNLHHPSSSSYHKKKVISPEEVIQLFSVPSNSHHPTSSISHHSAASHHLSHHGYGGISSRRERTSSGSAIIGNSAGRRSPASSPPSTTHQIYRDREHLYRDRNFSSIPNIHQLTTRTIYMKRDSPPGPPTATTSNQAKQSSVSKGSVNSTSSTVAEQPGFGICVKGNKAVGRGVYISRIEDGSPAYRSGLRAGDAILEINGQPFTSVPHEEALKKCVQILKSEKYISMTVRSQNTYSSVPPPIQKHHSFDDPQFDCCTDELYLPIPQQYHSPPPPSSISLPPPTVGRYQQCAWMDRHGRPVSPPYEYGGRRSDRRDRIRRIELLIEPGQSLGLMIRGGIEYGLGIFVTGIDKDSVAERAGLMIGDQILEVNNQSFMDITHDEAVNLLKYHKRMTILIRDVGKIPHSCTTLDHPQSSSSWHAGDTANSHYGTRDIRRKSSISLIIEEKARALLSRHHFSSLLYYLSEYGAKGMSIEAFVSILLELLDTPEKHTLVADIREIIYPEDRLRFDELMFRRGITVSNLGNNSASLYGRNGDFRRDLNEPRRGSDNQLSRTGSGYYAGSYLDGLRSLTQRVKSWYWGRPLSIQRLQMEQNGSAMQSNQQQNRQSDQSNQKLSHIVPDQDGNLLVTIAKTKPILGIAIEGGANTKHPLPRIINIHENGSAFETGGLEVGQLILEVDGQKVEGLQHQEIARLIAECYAKPNRHDITFLVTEAKKSNLEPKPTALIYLETLIVFIQLFFNIIFILL